MIVVVIGLGSMGKRRVRLIKEMYPTYKVLGIDSRKDRRDEVEKLFSISCYAETSELKEKIDCVFVCTSPLSHAGIIKNSISQGWNVFTELNLVIDGYEENMKLAKERGCVLFLSSSFLYREETKYISSKITQENKWNYIYHIGQYLPNWHPWENYRDFFAGDKRTNGCREIFAIELPWLVEAFGEIDRTQVIADKITGLKIDYNDNYMIQIIHKNGNKGVLIVDVVSPVAIRKLEVYAENKYISWNGTPDSIFEFDPMSGEMMNVKLSEIAEHREEYSSFIVENAYKNEIRDFFDVVLNHKDPLYGFDQDKQILAIIDSFGA